MIRLLINHPGVDIKFIHSKSNAGKNVYEVHEDLLGDTELKFDESWHNEIDVVFLCVGHGEAKKFLDESGAGLDGVLIIDLSQDYRLHSGGERPQVNGHPFVYGLPELNREEIRSAHGIANPGCFATTIQLGLLPLAKAGLLGDVYSTGITGSTGAGQSLSATSHFSWRANNIQAYKTLTHQHMKEVGQSLQQLQPGFGGGAAAGGAAGSGGAAATGGGAESAFRTGEVPLPSAEGFVRQVIGWREYMWHLYWHFGPDYLDRNALRAHTPLPDWFADLDADAVTAACLRSALEGVRDRGWTHHIQRLMVLGNHALQRGYRPAELSDWFREAFVDGFEWVMPPNVVGMSQHADGGMMDTKPYSAGGAYISRMSDHCGDCAFDPRKRLGDDACPFTAGYWAWTHRHRELLAGNRRTARAIASMDRLADLDAVLEQESARELF